jgi:hypothetical protein
MVALQALAAEDELQQQITLATAKFPIQQDP